MAQSEPHRIPNEAALTRLSTLQTRVKLLVMAGGPTLASLLVLWPAGSATERLPTPTDIPEGPPLVAAPGGNALPDMAGEASANAPAISAISDMTYPGETLVVTGEALEGARLRVWAEGHVVDVDASRTANDRMLALVPTEVPASTMLVWPVKGRLVGTPIRVNGATVWWAWPPRVEGERSSQTIRLFGKNLKLPGAATRVYLSGPGTSRWLQTIRAEPYDAEAHLPETLREGKYKVWVHNGTGGRYGWSHAASFEVRMRASLERAPRFPVDAFGARADDGRDDWEGVSAAVATARRAGGGFVEFGPGSYHMSRPVDVGPGGDRGVHLVGVGVGSTSDRDESRAGRYTAILPLRTETPPEALIRVAGARNSVKDLAILNRNTGRQETALAILAPDVVVERVLIALHDGRGAPSAKRRGVIDTGAAFIDSPGSANVVVQNSEIHAVGPGILIGTLQPGHDDLRGPTPSTDFVLVRNVAFRGFYAGEPDGGVKAWASGRSSGAAIYNAKNVIIEKSQFASADRYAGKVLGRTVNVFNTSARNLYLAYNTSIDVGSHPTARMNTNQGEQYLFHLRYPQGGLFDVVAANTRGVTVTTANVQPFGSDYKSGLGSWGSDGSRVLDEVGQNDHWVVFVCAGRGVGQYRVVVGARREGGRVRLETAEPWRVAPDATSRVNLMVAFRHSIIYGNRVNTGRLAESHKSVGALFWYSAFENIVANNQFRNLTSGVVINSAFRNPTGWNLVRENEFQDIKGFAGDTSLKAAAYVDHYRVYGNRWPEARDRVWYSVGNIARANRADGAEVAAYLHPRFERRRTEGTVPHANGGLVMSVVENGHFRRVKEGIVVESPAAWPVVRNNTVDIVATLD